MKNKLAALITSSILLLTTNTLPSHALNTHENLITKTTTNQTAKNEETLISRRRWRRRTRGRWITQRVTVCSIKRVYNNRLRRWKKVRICRRVPRRVYVRY